MTRVFPARELIALAYQAGQEGQVPVEEPVDVLLVGKVGVVVLGQDLHRHRAVVQGALAHRAVPTLADGLLHSGAVGQRSHATLACGECWNCYKNRID